MSSSDAIPIEASVAIRHMAAGEFALALPLWRHLNAGSAQDKTFLFNEGVCLYQTGRWQDARSAFEATLAIAPDWPPALSALGVTLVASGDVDAAIGHLTKACERHPYDASLHNALGHAYRQRGDFYAARRVLQTAIALNPNLADAHNNLALVHLVLGDWLAGWQHHVHRPRRQANEKTSSLPARASDLRGKRVLLRGEQGPGDELFFLRFVPALQAFGVEVRVRANPLLRDVLTAAGNVKLEQPGDDPPDAVFYLGDLPLLLSSSTTPPPLPLRARAEDVTVMRALFASSSAPTVGVTWRAGPLGTAPAAIVLRKEIPLADLVEKIPEGCRIAVLQRHPRPHELSYLRDRFGERVMDCSGLNGNLRAMAALLSVLDEYVTVSNTNVHIRAGLGLPCQVLVPHPPEWRWLYEGNFSPWFPGSQVFRQHPRDGWTPALETLGAKLGDRYGA